MVNGSDVAFWVEETSVAVMDLEATVQTSISPGSAAHQIRQNIRANETLALSLAAVLYEAAGKPQGRYSCLVGVEVRYRVGEQWFTENLETYKVEMTGLKARHLQHSRRYEKKVRQREPS